MANPKDIYPLATKDHQPIPLEAIKPISFYSINSGSYIELPVGAKLFYAEAVGGAALLAFGTAPPVVSNTVAIPLGIYLPWGGCVPVVVPELEGRRMHVVALQPTPVVVRLQIIECWQAIDQLAMLNKRL